MKILLAPDKFKDSLSAKEVCEAFDINPVTVRTGIQELKQGEELPAGRIRKEGGGRKKN